MKKELKKVVIGELKDQLAKSKAVFIFNFKGLTVADIGDLREKVIENEGMVKVAKNKLMDIALKETPFEPLSGSLKDNNAFVFSYDDPIAVTKILVEMSKKYEKMEIKTAVFEDGTLYNSADIEALSKIPGKTELIGQLLYMMNYPIQGLVTSLSGIIRNFVVDLDQIRQQKESV